MVRHLNLIFEDRHGNVLGEFEGLKLEDPFTIVDLYPGNNMYEQYRNCARGLRINALSEVQSKLRFNPDNDLRDRWAGVKVVHCTESGKALSAYYSSRKSVTSDVIEGERSPEAFNRLLPELVTRPSRRFSSGSSKPYLSP